jgi:hypothetical protein
MWKPRLSPTITPMSTTKEFIKRILGPVQQLPADPRALTLRHAVPADADELDRLAQLDSRRAPRGVVLVAEVGGELWAAVSLDDMHAVADPFRPTGELVALLVARARQLRRAEDGRLQGLPRVWPGTGYDRAALS